MGYSPRGHEEWTGLNTHMPAFKPRMKMLLHPQALGEDTHMLNSNSKLALSSVRWVVGVTAIRKLFFTEGTVPQESYKDPVHYL